MQRGFQSHRPHTIQGTAHVTLNLPFSLPLSQPFGEHTWIESRRCLIPGSPTLILLAAERIGDGGGVWDKRHNGPVWRPKRRLTSTAAVRVTYRWRVKKSQWAGEPPHPGPRLD